MFDDNSPVFEQVADYFRCQMLDGTLRDGEQLPATTQFAAAHKINPGTVTKGLAVLVTESLIEKRRGIGMFVVEGAQDRLRRGERDTFIADVFAPAIQRARLLGIDDAELIAAIDQS